MQSFKNKTILITGGANGIGKLLALKFAGKGAEVIIWDIDKPKINQLEQEAAEKGYNLTAFFCDLSQRDMIYDTAEKTLEMKGKVDILINNAGIVNGQCILETADDEIQRLMDINLMSQFWMIKAFLPSMLKADAGYVVFIASAAGMFGASRLADYSASKFGNFGFHESLNWELRDLGSKVRTMVVCPLVINTALFAGVRGRFLLPVLKTDYVVNKIIKAIAKNKKYLFIPGRVRLIWLLRLLPTPVFEWLINLLGLNRTMNGFVGRS
ncbi:SDR family oxidoreductase [bacterium]|nr:SDR family oxidoreductase [bacterium]